MSAGTGRVPTVLVSAPFLARTGPSIQLGLLAAIGRRHGFAVQTLHANLDFAAQIGPTAYDRIAANRGHQLGDWLFAVAAFGEDAPDLRGDLLEELTDAAVDDLRALRDEAVPSYLDALVDGYAWDQFAVVGFSSTFAQNTASFALARRLKERLPHLVTLFGGANFDGDMGKEWVRTVDAIDYAVIGEGDTAFPRLLAAIAAGTDPGLVPGVARRIDGAVIATAAAPLLSTLDELPDPDYDEYFERAERLGVRTRRQRHLTRIPLESARGCWWGVKHHCTFCGLNGQSMAFRSKSAARVVDELARQSRRYGSFHFDAVDNILDTSYLTQLLPALRDARTGYDLFYEVKANLSRDDLQLLAAAGVGHIQPGLESLSTNVLRLMRKGIRAVQNVNTLRWAHHYGIRVDWNLLWGFPGETAADYAEQAALMPALWHLPPPAGAGRLWLERFSPLFTEAATNGIRCRPERSYELVYPERVDLSRAAYFFDYEVEGALPDEVYRPSVDAVAAWRRAWDSGSPPVLEVRSAPGHAQIFDGRRRGDEVTVDLYDELAEIYLACLDRPTTAAALAQRLDLSCSVEEIGQVLAELTRRGLMLLDGTWALALALPAVTGR